MVGEQSVPMLTRRFKEKTVGGKGGGCRDLQVAAHLPVPSNCDLKPGFSLREKLSYFAEVFPTRLFSLLFFLLFLFADQSLGPAPSPELQRLKYPAGGRDLRVPNPQRRVRFKGTVIWFERGFSLVTRVLMQRDVMMNTLGTRDDQ